MSQLAPFIQNELTKFNDEIKESDLLELVSKYKDLRIASVDDKEGYKAVYDARQILKDKRIEITKKGKTLRESAVVFQKAVIARENQLVEITEPTEKALKAEEERIDLERERIRKEAEEKENQRVNNMIAKLNAINYAVDYTQLKNLNDASFEELLKEATAQFEKEELARKQKEAEELELKRQEEERLEFVKKELEAERERIRLQQEEMRKAQEELTKFQIATQKALAEEQERREMAIQQKLESERAAILEEQNRIRKEQEAREAAIKAETERLEAEKLAIQQKKDAEERERLRVIQEEEDRKAAEAKAIKDEQDRQARINEEAIEKGLYAEDTKLFFGIADYLSACVFPQGATSVDLWSQFQSNKGKQAAKEVHELLLKAHKICKEHE